MQPTDPFFSPVLIANPELARTIYSYRPDKNSDNLKNGNGSEQNED